MRASPTQPLAKAARARRGCARCIGRATRAASPRKSIRGGRKLRSGSLGGSRAAPAAATRRGSAVTRAPERGFCGACAPRHGAASGCDEGCQNGCRAPPSHRGSLSGGQRAPSRGPSVWRVGATVRACVHTGETLQRQGAQRGARGGAHSRSIRCQAGAGWTRSKHERLQCFVADLVRHLQHKGCAELLFRCAAFRAMVDLGVSRHIVLTRHKP